MYHFNANMTANLLGSPFLAQNCFLRFKVLVTFIKKSFIILSVSSSLLTMSFPFTKVIFEELGSLSLKNGLILFQKLNLFVNSLAF